MKGKVMARRFFGAAWVMGLAALAGGADSPKGVEVVIYASGPFEIEGGTVVFYSGLAQDRDLAVLEAHPEVTGVQFVATPMSIHFPSGGIGEGTSAFRITDDGFSRIGKAKKIERLIFDARKPLPLSDKAFASLSALDLKVVKLGVTAVTAAGLIALAKKESLEEFSAYQCKMADVVAAIADCSHLRKLELSPKSSFYAKSGSIFKKPDDPASATDADIAKLAKLTDLEELYLDDCLLSDEAVSTLVQFKKLRVLHVQGSKITDVGIRQLGQLSALETLNLNGTGITDEGMATLATLSKLQTLYLTDTQITDEGVKGIARMRGLLNVSLRGTAVTGKGVALFYPGKVVDR